MATKQLKTKKTLALFEYIQTMDKEFPLQYLICFYHIALEPGISVSALAKKANINLSTTSRIIGALSIWRANNKPYELITIKPHPNERRKKQLFLTKHGEGFLAKLLSRVD